MYAIMCTYSLMHTAEHLFSFRLISVALASQGQLPPPLLCVSVILELDCGRFYSCGERSAGIYKIYLRFPEASLPFLFLFFGFLSCNFILPPPLCLFLSSHPLPPPPPSVVYYITEQQTLIGAYLLCLIKPDCYWQVNCPLPQDLQRSSHYLQLRRSLPFSVSVSDQSVA